MAITQGVNGVTENSVAVTSASMNYPSETIVAGNLLLLFMGHTTAPTAPAGQGWTQVSTTVAADSTNCLTVWKKTAAGGESGTTGAWTFASTKYAACMIQYGGVDAVITDVTPVTNAVINTSTTLLIPSAGSYTTVTDGCLLISAFNGNSASQVMTQPSGYTKDFQNQTGTTTKQCSVAHLAQATAASVTATWTWGTSVSLAKNGMLFALRPAAGAAPVPEKLLVGQQALVRSYNW